MGRVFGYGRISDPQKDETPEQQEYACKEGYRKKFEATHEWAGFLCDLGESGGKEIARRPNGARLCAQLEKGDVVIFPKLDRGFRSVMDMLTMFKVWDQLGVDIVLLDIGMDTTTALGRAFVKIAAVIAELERERVSERMKDFFASRRRQGRPVGGKAPYGFRYVGPKGNRQFAPDPEKRRIGKLALKWRTEGYTWDAIYWALVRRGERQANGKEWARSTLQRLAEGEAKLQGREAADAQGRKKKTEIDGQGPVS